MSANDQEVPAEGRDLYFVAMTSGEAMLELLKLELQAIQGGIRGLDAILFQIKGWCVTVTVAIAGFALTQNRPGLLLLGLVVVIAFWLVDAHYKSVQRIFIERDLCIQSKLLGKDPLAVLEAGDLEVPALAPKFKTKLGPELRAASKEAVNPITAGLYLVVAVALGVESLMI